MSKAQEQKVLVAKVAFNWLVNFMKESKKNIFEPAKLYTSVALDKYYLCIFGDSACFELPEQISDFLDVLYDVVNSEGYNAELNSIHTVLAIDF